MAEKVSFQVGVNADFQGRPVVSDNFDFAENWRESVRHRINLGTDTGTTHTVALGGVVDARIVAIDVNKPVRMQLESLQDVTSASTFDSTNSFTIRGKAIMQIDSQTIIIKNLNSYTTPNEATVIVWGA